ncbi:TolC family protein [Orbus wheelerorum]|uniref:TolC family protein n=1 Tax=Orbus wheelerorum TaxID=3074111 RepID=UPI00370D15D8
MKMQINAITKLVLLCSFILVGCSNSSYQQNSLTSQLSYTPQVANDYLVDQKWWQAYQDPQLDKLIEQGLANNIDLAQSLLTMQKAMYEANLSKVDLYPTLSGDLGATTSRNTYKHDSFNKNRSFSGELSLSYELDVLQKLHDSADANVAKYQASQFDVDNVRLTLINSIIDVYYNLAYLNAAITATQSSLTNYQQMNNVTSAKYYKGKTDELDLLQIVQSIKSDENSLLTYQTQLKENEQTLRNLLNLKPSDQLNLNYPDMTMIKPLAVDLDIPLSVLANRPDLKASELRLEAAFKDLAAQNKSWYPAITLKTAISSSDNNIGNTFDFPVLLGSISISLPFLDWDRVSNNIHISETDYQTAQLNFENSINTALNEVAYYYQAYNNNRIILDNSQQQFTANVKIMQLYDKRYQSGKSEFKDYLDSINTVNSSKINLINEHYQLIKDENMVFKAMAGRYHNIASH